MYEIYFDEYYVSEQELKEKIHSTLTWLNKYEPETWETEFVNFADPNKSSTEILSELANIPPLLHLKPIFSNFEMIECLRIIAITLDTQLDKKRLDHLFIRHSYMMAANYFIMLRYFIAVGVMQEKYNAELFTNRDAIAELLMKFGNDSDSILGGLVASKAAKEEIDRLYSEPSAKEFVESIFEFEKGIDQYIRNNYYAVSMQGFIQLSLEAITSNAHIIDKQIQLAHPLTSEDRKELLKQIEKFVRQSVSKRLEIKRGGKRERKGFVWTAECKIEFYKTVEGLPKINEKPMWDYAYEDLIEKDFNYKYIDYLRTQTEFKAVPEQLFSLAVRTWEKYKDSFNNPNPNEKPFAFALLHGLELLEYPDTKYSTMKKYFSEGKKLSNLDK